MLQKTSPSGRYEITIYSHEAFNTCWVETPTLIDKQTGETLLAFRHDHWSLDAAEWCGDARVSFTLRKYPGNHEPSDVIALIDCEARTASVGESAPGSLSSLEERLGEALTWIYAKPAEPRTNWLQRLQRFLRGQ